MDVAREAGGGGTGSARRRRERRLRQWHRHERMTVAMALAECMHHSAQRPEKARAGGRVREELHGEAPEELPLQEPGTQYYAMTPEDWCVPELGGGRPAPVLEPRPPEGMGRHTGVGYEVLLDVRVPKMGAQDAERALPAFLQRRKEDVWPG